MQSFVQVYHKQLNVLHYAAAANGAVIRHTREGQIKHKALSAMEEQTQMQLEGRLRSFQTFRCLGSVARRPYLDRSGILSIAFFIPQGVYIFY